MREFLADASSYFGQRAVNIWIEDGKPDATLGPALIAAGVASDRSNIHLAHVGLRPDRFQLSGVTVRRVTVDTLMDYLW